MNAKRVEEAKRQILEAIMRLSETFMMIAAQSPLDEAGDMTAVSMTLALMAIDSGMTKAEAMEAFTEIWDVVAEKYRSGEARS
jgi:hypothetical protein